MIAVTIADISHEYSGFRLGPLSLHLAAGSSTALVGPSGSGKSTLLRCIAGLLRPSGGCIAFGDRQVFGPGVDVSPDRRGIGFVFQGDALWPHMTCVDHLRFVAPQVSKAAALELLQRVGLNPAHAGRRPAALSGGEAQRLALARALAPRPALLLLDEPLSSVDVHLRDELALLVRETVREQGLTMVLVTHDRDEALAMADNLVVLREGQCVEQGGALDLLRRPGAAFTAAFLGGAACLPTERFGTRLRTAFGDLDLPAAGDGQWFLVLLPGEAALAGEGGLGPSARVIRSEPSVPGYRVWVAMDGRTVQIHSVQPLPAGSTVVLRLVGAPRLLR